MNNLGGFFRVKNFIYALAYLLMTLSIFSGDEPQGVMLYLAQGGIPEVVVAYGFLASGVILLYNAIRDEPANYIVHVTFLLYTIATIALAFIGNIPPAPAIFYGCLALVHLLDWRYILWNNLTT